MNPSMKTGDGRPTKLVWSSSLIFVLIGFDTMEKKGDDMFFFAFRFSPRALLFEKSPRTNDAERVTIIACTRHLFCLEGRFTPRAREFVVRPPVFSVRSWRTR